MARIAGVDLPKNKVAEIGLTSIYGIGRPVARKILAEAGIETTKRVKDFTEEEEAKIREIIERDYVVEGDLRKEIAIEVKDIKEDFLFVVKEQRLMQEQEKVKQNQLLERKEYKKWLEREK